MPIHNNKKHTQKEVEQDQDQGQGQARTTKKMKINQINIINIHPHDNRIHTNTNDISHHHHIVDPSSVIRGKSTSPTKDINMNISTSTSTNSIMKSKDNDATSADASACASVGTCTPMCSSDESTTTVMATATATSTSKTSSNVQSIQDIQDLEYEIQTKIQLLHKEEEKVRSSQMQQQEAHSQTQTQARIQIQAQQNEEEKESLAGIITPPSMIMIQLEPTRSKLELQRTLNEQIIHLQSLKEKKRVQDVLTLQKRSMMQNEKTNATNATTTITTTTTEPTRCSLCLQPIKKRIQYDDRTYEYFTCCGESVCKSCHVIYVSSHDNNDDDDLLDDYDIPDFNHDFISTSNSTIPTTTTTSATTTNNSDVTIRTKVEVQTQTQKKTKKAIISSQYEKLLNEHKCPFCQEPWSKDEFIDSQRILKLAEKDTKKNTNCWAMVEIARRYEHGMGIEPNEELAAKWFTTAAELGDASGQYNIGRFYKWSYTNMSDIDMEMNTNMDTSTNENDPESSDLLSQESQSQQEKTAKQFFMKAANQGHAKAQHDLATILVNEYETQQDDCSCEEALHWFTLSLSQGYDEALYGLGNLYLMRGKMKTNKIEKAFEFGRALYWLRQSAEDEKGLSRGQMLLGMALLENAKNAYGSSLREYTCSGFNIVPEVFYWLRKSSHNGELDAGTRLKNCQNVHLKQCAFCHKTGDLNWKKCNRCCGVSYCSEECQDKDWVGGHKHDCLEDPLVSMEGTSLMINIT
jgi:TPR repeat protein